MNNQHFRSDLILESTEIFKTPSTYSNFNYPSGVDVTESQEGGIYIHRVQIITEDGEKAIGKPIGKYVTLEIPGLSSGEFSDYQSAYNLLGKELNDLLELSNKGLALVVGLGNWNITPDSLGPRVVSETNVTRHILEYGDPKSKEDLKGLRPVCAISPGVLGITGIETFEIVRGVVDRLNPSCVIVVDSLSSRKTQRVSNTIQLSNTGISPGSGVGNKRKEITKETLGRPVIAIGVPTVIDAATLATDAILMMLEDIKKSMEQFPDELQRIASLSEKPSFEMDDLIKRLLKPYYESLIVTPKEIDDIIDRVTSILSEGINIALGVKNLNNYIN
jgi:spore protease